MIGNCAIAVKLNKIKAQSIPLVSELNVAIGAELACVPKPLYRISKWDHQIEHFHSRIVRFRIQNWEVYLDIYFFGTECRTYQHGEFSVAEIEVSILI